MPRTLRRTRAARMAILCVLIAGLASTVPQATARTRSLRSVVVMRFPPPGKVHSRDGRFRVGHHLKKVYMQLRQSNGVYGYRIAPGRLAIVTDRSGRPVGSLQLIGRYYRSSGRLRLTLRIKNVQLRTGYRRAHVTVRVTMVTG